jgi:hypothetical protein
VPPRAADPDARAARGVGEVDGDGDAGGVVREVGFREEVEEVLGDAELKVAALAEVRDVDPLAGQRVGVEVAPSVLTPPHAAEQQYRRSVAVPGAGTESSTQKDRFCPTSGSPLGFAGAGRKRLEREARAQRRRVEHEVGQLLRPRPPGEHDRGKGERRGPHVVRSGIAGSRSRAVMRR